MLIFNLHWRFVTKCSLSPILGLSKRVVIAQANCHMFLDIKTFKGKEYLFKLVEKTTCSISYTNFTTGRIRRFFKETCSKLRFFSLPMLGEKTYSTKGPFFRNPSLVNVFPFLGSLLTQSKGMRPVSFFNK